jgi:methylmalonyl-CoA/ethylmalonyl-CoA epimerase
MEKAKGKFDFCQVGIVIKDLDKTIKEFEDLFGLKPFVVVERKYANTYVREKPTEFKIKIALYRATDRVNIELIQVREGDTIYDEWIRERGEGLHHLAYEIENIEAWIEYFKSKGISVLQRGERPGVKFAYLDTSAYTRFIMELIERSEQAR